MVDPNPAGWSSARRPPLRTPGLHLWQEVLPARLHLAGHTGLAADGRHLPCPAFCLSTSPSHWLNGLASAGRTSPFSEHCLSQRFLQDTFFSSDGAPRLARRSRTDPWQHGGKTSQRNKFDQLSPQKVMLMYVQRFQSSSQPPSPTWSHG